MNSDPRRVDAQEKHPEIEEISALGEGVLPADRTEDVRSHLARCPLCTDVQESLDEIRGLLGQLPGPVLMPADIVGRIDAALAAETLLTASPVVPDRAVSPPPPSDGPPGGPSRRARSDGPAAGARSGPGRGKRSRRRQRSAAVIGGAFGAAVLGFGAFFLTTVVSSNGTGAADRAATGASAEKHAAAVRLYTDGTVAAMVRELLTGTRNDRDYGATGEGLDTKGTKSPLDAPREDGARRTGGAALPQCVLDATQRPSETPLATDFGLYEGKRVGVVVLADRGDEKAVNVFLVDSACETGRPSGPGKVLLERSVPRS